MKWFKKKFIGDRAFYASVMILLVPMVVQNVVTNFVSMLDNIMVGQLGTEAMSGVSIANQFTFIFNITIFGAISGPGIFGAQFFGKGDSEGQKQTLRFRLLIALLLTGLFMAVFVIFSEPLLSLYIAADDAPAQAAATLKYGVQYMLVMVTGLIPFSLGQVYASVVRESGESRIPMYGSMAAVVVNLILDYGLIFGKLGMPGWGVMGAAVATVVAKCIEAMVVIVWAHTHKERNPYIGGLYHGFYIDPDLLKQMIRKGLPLLCNEFLWVVGVSAINQCYSVRGLDVVGARNIATVITNLFGIVYIQIGSATAIILGNRLGAGKLDEARDTANKLLAFSVFCATMVAIIMLPLVPVFPKLYNTTPEIRSMASFIILVTATAMPMMSFDNACYFTIRSGGRTGITFLFDFLFAWLLQIPLAFLLAYRTTMDFRLLYILVTYVEIVKVVIGFAMVRSNMWIRNLVA